MLILHYKFQIPSEADIPTYMSSPTAKQELLTRAIDTILPTPESFVEAMDEAEANGKRLRGYLGIDPTSPHLHIGHTVAMSNLALFQQAGHQAILLIGDFTGRLGDPDKLATRAPLSKERVRENMATYLDQARHILDFDGDNPVEVRYNSEWSDGMTFEEIIGLASHFTVQQMLERDMFQRRIREERPISLSEFFYPLMQGYDAVALQADVQFGGTDQIFNMLAGRTLNRVLAGREMHVIANPLLADSNGVKIGKTMGNAINIDNPPQELYGQMMSLPDEAIVPGLRLLTTCPLDEVARIAREIESGTNPMDAKKTLARLVVSRYHGAAAAESAQAHFEQTVQGGALPDTIEDRVVDRADWDMAELLLALGVCDSKGQARRLIEQGGVEVDGRKFSEKMFVINSPTIVKAGKRTYLRVHASAPAEE
jgi:tyrosyl-tRNA synthetase